jgi:putative hydrolase of the HAD superfamily
MKLRAVIFDFGGVLCFHPTEQQLAEAAQLCGLTVPVFWEAFWRKRREYDRGGDPAEYWRDIARMTGRTFDDAMVAEMVRHEIDFWSRFDDRVLDWTNDLRGAGLRTSILSNLPRPLGERLRATAGFLGHFDQVTFSYELGVIKPQPEIYQYAVRELGIAPSDALFLDDRPENVEGAREAGLSAELFVSWEQFLEQDRARYGLPEPVRQTA